MCFMIVVKASKNSKGGATPLQEMFASMADYHEELAKAGVLLDGNAMQPSSKGWRISWAGGKKKIIDWQFAETKELIAGYTIT